MDTSDPGAVFLESAVFRFQNLESLGRKAIEQLDNQGLLWRANSETNSLSLIHI